MTVAAAAELEAYLVARRRRIEDALDRVLPPLGTPPPILHEAMRYTVLLPGKRLRGILVLASAEVFRGRAEAALSLACAVEMVHAASLILDDLPCMDNATIRRGRKALHLVVGEANAILAAIGLLSGAFALVQGAPELGAKERSDATAALASAIGGEGLVGGQVVDLESTGKRLGLEELEYVHSHKTGALFIAAAELGAIAAGGRPRRIEPLRRYAKNLGLAFQITDDLLDYSGSPETTGKDAGLDRDRTTFVNLCGIDGARRLVDELIGASIEALAPFGRRAAILASLAEYVRVRDR
jgi:geranylgeranyl diphosphate synthase type II